MGNKLFVFDTNVFVSAALLAGSVNDLALDKAFKSGKVAISEATFSEFTEVLFRKKFDKYLTDDRRLNIIEKLERGTPFFLRLTQLSISAVIQKIINFWNWR